MNESVKSWAKKNLGWLIALGVLLIWSICGTIAGTHYHNRYAELKYTVAAADGGELAELVQQHENTIVVLQHDLGTANEYIRAADERAELTDRIIERAYGYAQLSDAEFIELRNTVASSGSTISEAVRTQYRIIAIAGRIEGNNTAVKMELGMRDGASAGR